MKNISFNDFDFYIVHIQSSHDRYEHLKNEFHKLDIDINSSNRIHFVDGIIPDIKAKYKTRGKYGASLGHFNAMRQSLDNINPYCFICEDDVCFLDGAIEGINLTLDNLCKNREKYDIVQFRTPRFPCNTSRCAIVDNYIKGICRLVPIECCYLTKTARYNIVNNKEWFFNGRVVDLWYQRNLKCIKTIENYTYQNNTLRSIVRSLKQ